MADRTSGYVRSASRQRVGGRGIMEVQVGRRVFGVRPGGDDQMTTSSAVFVIGGIVRRGVVTNVEGTEKTGLRVRSAASDTAAKRWTKQTTKHGFKRIKADMRKRRDKSVWMPFASTSSGV